MVAPEEAAASVATTLYTGWRSASRDATFTSPLYASQLGKWPTVDYAECS